MDIEQGLLRLLHLLPLLLFCFALLQPATFVSWGHTFLGKAALVLLIPVFGSLSFYFGVVYCFALILFYQQTETLLQLI